MKNILLVLMLPIFLLSYELEFNKKFTSYVYPDKLSTNISISFFSTDQNEVINKIDYFNSYIKNIKDVKLKDITFNINPKYDYKDNESNFKGYNGIITYSAESDDSNKMNIFLNELIKVTNLENQKDIIIDIQNISWLVSDELKNEKIEELRTDSINWVNKNYLNKNCKILKIRVLEDYDSFALPKKEYSLNILKSNFDTNLAKEEKFLSIITNYSLNCN